MEQLYGVATPADLLELLDRHPELEQGTAGNELRAMAAMPGWGAMFQACADLIDGVRTDLDAAWATFTARRDDIAAAGDELEETVEALDAAMASHDYEKVIELAEPAIARATGAGLGLPASYLHGKRGQALLNLQSTDRAANLEKAIEAYEAALELSEPGVGRAELQEQLALVFSERIAGDRADNHDVAIGLLGDALEELPADSSPELEARMRTHLAVLLVRSERHDRVDALSTAVDLCQEALIFRSPQRDAADWAYSQLNLGEALEQLADLGQGTYSDAATEYRRVVDEANRIVEPWLVGVGHHTLGRLGLRNAGRLQEPIDGVDRIDEDGDLSEPDPALEKERVELLEVALAELEEAVRLTRTGPDPLRLGYVLNDLADAHAELENHDAAIQAGAEALAILRPTTSPRACRRAGWRQGNLLAQQSRWAEAATAFGDAVDAAELVFHSRIENEGRMEETREAGNLYRWAAYATTAAGHPTRAALVLESGRARELRRRLGPGPLTADVADQVPAELVDELAAAVSELAAAPLNAQSTRPAAQLQGVLTAIRSHPGLATFAAGATADELTGAVEPDWPLFYVDPTPYGTLLLCVQLKDGELTVDGHCLPKPTSLDIFMKLMVGRDVSELNDSDKEPEGSFLLGITGQDPHRDIAPDIESPLPALGRGIAEPIARLAEQAGASGVTLVTCGPIACAPLHAATWQQGGHTRCLVDELDVRYAPSAALAGTALTRSAAPPGDQRLVLLANPHPNTPDDLPAAEAEAREIEALVPSASVTAAYGASATSDFLRRHVSDAHRLHLACHASGSLFEADAAAVLLADGWLPASDLTGLYPLCARSAVVSACQSAMSEITTVPDEPSSIGTALLATGVACAIVSLWSVDDLATAILMLRFYEEAIDGGRRPPEALRRAQLWLRGLTEEQEAEFVNRHPELAAEYRRRATAKELPGHRSRTPPALHFPGLYAHPKYWSAFVAVGA